jgi:hypothetical protein
MDHNFKPRSARTSMLVLMAITCLPAHAQARATAAQTFPADEGWPRQYSDGTAKLVVYQPQVDSWKNFRRLEGRFAIALWPSQTSRAAYGVVRVKADTVVDTRSRTVAFTNFMITDASYPSAKDETEARDLTELTVKLFPQTPTSVSLDRVLAYMDRSQIKARPAAVKLEPPLILVSTQPAILVIIDGEPAFFDIEDTSLRKVLNTNWDLLFDTKAKRYYLRYEKSWLSAQTLTGAWRPEDKLSKEFSKLPASDSFWEIKQTAAWPQKLFPVPLVLVVHKPTELIVIDGAPFLQPMAGTQLSWIPNTDCDLFYSSADRNYYFLTSGRWFRSAQLSGGQWTAATAALPPDFKKLPLDHPRAHVLASIPGTRQADEAIITASIPQTAQIDRKTAKAQVHYIGDPAFEEIPGTGVSYASNTPNDVLKVGDLYYLCLQGVWFVSESASGPWMTADQVPHEIYTIPPESPKHNVTYVTVYESTPETVTYGYTAGYTGVYVGYGVAMWGTGYYYPSYYGWGYYGYPVYWPASYYTYGASTWYNPATGAYARGSAVYGPYGGYGRAAAYNPSTGRYAWGQAAWAPYGAAASGGFYNPNTGGWAGGYRAGNGYQSWGQSVVGRGSDQWARTASYSDSRGTLAGIQTSAGGKAVAARGSQGGWGFAARSAAGDVYAGRDGNVYKRDQSGQWYRNNGGSWETVTRASNTRPREALGSRDRTAGQPTIGVSSNDGGMGIQGLNRDAAARSWGNYNTQRSIPTRQSGSFGSSSRMSSGFASRGGGGRRR